MTLEQIKQEQQNLNTRLVNILEDLTQTITTITGDFVEPAFKKEEPLANGLLNNIEYEQRVTSELLDSLSTVKNRLASHTYQMEEAPVHLKTDFVNS